MNNRFKNAQSIFMVAIEEYDPDQWSSYLDGQCADDQGLRERLDELLAAHVDMGSIEVSSPDSTLNESITDLAGTQIGPYKLREELGDGGMGVVYAAEQTEPIRRKVALKVIKPGMDTREVIARFEVERRALAMMDHQNIARVLDAGTTDSGRPYFVMELVRGLSVTKYCDQNKLSIRNRLELFIKICLAVQHAHQKGIIHRDIKPGNVMVTLHDGVPVPKVIDFGVAKAIDQRVTEGSVYTKVSQIVGTPAYMSPEQAELSGLDIDTRSDIYSLGVLLYELLTGSTPFPKEQLSKADFDEMRRIIRDTEPQRPSDRISTLNAEAISTVATNRSDNQRKLTHAIRDELDWIVLKTLEKDRTRRYETASGLAAEIRRYLDNEPVVACQPSAIYKFRKFSRRNRGVLAAGLLVFASLMVGATISTWQAIRASIAEQRSAENFNMTLDSLKTAYSFAQHLDEEPELEPWHREVLTDAFETCQQVIDRLEGQPEFADDLMELLVIAGRIHYRMDRLQPAAELLSRAIDIGEDASSKDNNTTRTILANAYDQMAAVHVALGPSDGLAELQEANKIWASEVLEPGAESDQVIKLVKNNLAMAKVLHRNGDEILALQLTEKSLQVCDDWLASHDDRKLSEVRVEALVDLAHALAGVSERDRAGKLAQEAYDLATSLELRSEVLAGSARALADLLCNSRETVEQAERLFDQARELRAQLASDYPNHIPHRAKYARSLLRLSQYKARLGKNAESKQLLMDAIQINDEMTSQQGDNIGVLSQLASLYVARGQAAISLGNRDDSLKMFTDELQLRENLQARRDDVSARKNMAAALTRIAEYHLQAAKSKSRKQNGKKGEALLRRANELLSTTPEIGVNQSLLGLSGTIAEGLARSLHFQGRDTEAESAIKQAIKYHELVSEHSSQELKRLAGDLNNHAWVIGGSQEKERTSARINSAKQMCLKAIELQEQAISLAISDAEKDGCIIFLSNHYYILGDLHFEQSEFRESLACFDRSVDLNPNQSPYRTGWFAEAYVIHVPEDLRDAKRAEELARLALKQDSDCGVAQWSLAVALFRQGKFEQAIIHFESFSFEGGDNPDHQAYLGMTRYRLGDFESAAELLQFAHEGPTEAALYLVMAVVRSEKEFPDATVTKQNVEELFKNAVEQSKKESDQPKLIKELIEETRTVLHELNER